MKSTALKMVGRSGGGELFEKYSWIRKVLGSENVPDVNLHPTWPRKLMTSEKLPEFYIFPHIAYVNARQQKGSFSNPLTFFHFYEFGGNHEQIEYNSFYVQCLFETFFINVTILVILV